MSNVGSSVIQSILVKRRSGFSLEDAIGEVLRIGGVVTKIDVTSKWYRFRQLEPNYNKYTYRTKKINDDLMFIVGFPSTK